MFKKSIKCDGIDRQLRGDCVHNFTTSQCVFATETALWSTNMPKNTHTKAYSVVNYSPCDIIHSSLVFFLATSHLLSAKFKKEKRTTTRKKEQQKFKNLKIYSKN